MAQFSKSRRWFRSCMLLGNVVDADQIASLHHPALQQTLYLGSKVPPRGGELSMLPLKPSHAHLQVIRVSARVRSLRVWAV